MPLAMSASQLPQQGVIWSKEGTGVGKSFSFKKRPQKAQKKNKPYIPFCQTKTAGTTFKHPQPLRTPKETSSDFVALRLTPPHSTYNPRLLRVRRLRDFAKRKLRAQVSTHNLFALLMKHFWTPPHSPRLISVQRFRATSQASSLFSLHLSIGIFQNKISCYFI